MKPGYKQTEVGVIPEEWEVKSLGELAALYQPVTISAKQFTEAGYPVYGANGVVGFYHSANHQTSQVTVTCRGSTCGTVNRTVDECWITGNAMVLNCDQNKTLSKDFFYFLLLGQNMSGCITGTGQPQIVRSPLAAFRVALPSTLPEQRAIATALSDVDGLLGGLDRLIAKKRDLKQAAMQQLLTGQTRLPGWDGAWESVRLGDVADPSRSWSFTGGPFGSNLKSSDYTESGVRIIQLQNIGDGEFKDDYEIYTSVAKADELLSCNIYPGEIILSKMGDPVARACIIPSRHNRYLMCSDGIRLAVDSSRFANNFVFAQINAPDFRNRAANAGTGSTRKRIGLTELRNLPLMCPPTKDEQTAIAEVLTEMDGELAVLEQRREKTRALKQAMMQELLTGRTRLL